MSLPPNDLSATEDNNHVVRLMTWAKQRRRDRQFNQIDVVNQMVRLVAELHDQREEIVLLKKNQLMLTMALTELLARVEGE